MNNKKEATILVLNEFRPRDLYKFIECSQKYLELADVLKTIECNITNLKNEILKLENLGKKMDFNNFSNSEILQLKKNIDVQKNKKKNILSEFQEELSNLETKIENVIKDYKLSGIDFSCVDAELLKFIETNIVPKSKEKYKESLQEYFFRAALYLNDNNDYFSADLSKHDDEIYIKDIIKQAHVKKYISVCQCVGFGGCRLWFLHSFYDMNIKNGKYVSLTCDHYTKHGCSNIGLRLSVPADIFTDYNKFNLDTTKCFCTKERIEMPKN